MRVNTVLYSMLFGTLTVQATEQVPSVVTVTKKVHQQSSQEETRCNHGAAVSTLTSVCCAPKDVVFNTVVTSSLIVETVCANNEEVNKLNVQLTTASRYYNNLNRGEQINGEREIFPAYGNPVNLGIIANPPAGIQFGTAVATNRDGSIVVVGAPGCPNTATPAIYIFMQLFDSWVLVQTITSNAGSCFGTSIAISGDGSIIAVGAEEPLGIGSGRVDTYVQTGPTTWTFTQTLTGPGSANGDQVGTSVAISYDGSVIAIGTDGPSNKAYVYRQAVQPCSSAAMPVWNFEQTLSDMQQVDENFGFSVTLNADGSVLAVGAPLFDQGPIVDNGTVFLFIHTDITGWTLLKQINPDPTQVGFDTPNSEFGFAVAFNGNATGLVIGAPGWTTSLIVGVTVYMDKPLIFSSQRFSYNPNTNGNGTAVDISHDGRIFLGNNIGGVIPWLGTANVPVLTLAGTNTIFFPSQVIGGAPSSGFGSAARISRDGGYIIIGAPALNAFTGTAFIYRTAGGVIPINLCISRDLHIGRDMYQLGDYFMAGELFVSPDKSAHATVVPPSLFATTPCVDQTTA